MATQPGKCKGPAGPVKYRWQARRSCASKTAVGRGRALRTPRRASRARGRATSEPRRINSEIMPIAVWADSSTAPYPHIGLPPMTAEQHSITLEMGVPLGDQITPDTLFDECYAARTVAELDDVTVPLISLEHLPVEDLTAAVRTRAGRKLRLQSTRANAARQLTTAMAVLCRRQLSTGPSASAPCNSKTAEGLASRRPSKHNLLARRRGRQAGSAVSTREPGKHAFYLLEVGQAIGRPHSCAAENRIR